jgi:hypothetical protein
MSLPSVPQRAANFAVFQLAWFAAVIGAQRGVPAWGTAAIALAVLWHLARAARPRRELALVLLACLAGAAFESARLWQADVRYASGQPLAWLPPYWLVALWGLLAITLNVSLRWLHGRPGLAAVLGCFGGPLSFEAGVHLGAATFIDERAALVSLAAGWTFMMPLLAWLARRWDGIAPEEPPHA